MAIGLSLNRAFGASAIAAAATGGLLLGAGRRAGDPLSTFTMMGRTLLASRGVVVEVVPSAAALLGGLHHVGIVLLWGTLLAIVAGALRPVARLLLIAGGSALLAWASAAVLPLLARPDVGAPPSLRVALFVALALGLLVGLWAAAPSHAARR
ncbi:MAG: hypothetical protein MUF00_14390 [Gemmatimonadaceae bacterium]|jgi:hypothetical protein|nr:hypothetical protein [Gemmatimonadaceae bacterium]